MAYPPLRQPRLADVITERLEAMMLEGSLLPGQKLPPERELAEQFGVSRPSVREAIQKLSARGLLTSRQGGGNFVSERLNGGFDDPMLEMLARHEEFHLDLLEFRSAMEGIAAYYAALRSTQADRDRLQACFDALTDSYNHPSSERHAQSEAQADAAFHFAIAEAAHNVLVLHNVRGIFHLLEKSITANLAFLFEKPGTRDVLIQQHRTLLEAILEGRADDARASAHEHLAFVEDNILEMERAETRNQRALRRSQTHLPR
ncbi:MULTISPECIES: GntR family transcriptional regulator [Larsenimonas]|uniref:Pyruvate dehydrogenase complex repressor n=1 Tax=Larsenimonas suaedae TaxID=1851019 RepID=A0ABU1GS92_9GAMM|nr:MULTISPECIES: GntR family transcriptional regulator [Larsenimonas]MCM2972751.1 GntR family transcriptional regulator [Larsenimonas suaedae]MCM5704731.1 GntR family transcriptional regulator [Larsenimonas salina]MDR5894452.1 GntR family transcriptional regulator [Larsenimonas suaedae]